ncbi:unnamed protein product [Lactuca saligna]|uniref:Uncharacterized protein n=1 Tax=Lactuca saligna TaxID=75948 RepID=A0AA35YX46_LACSI|nr:unnamed protein product [Lactuca saligna]
MHLPTTDFFNRIIREYGYSLRELARIAINKIMGFEALFRILCYFTTVSTFKYFFNASTQSGTRTLSHRRGVPTLIHDKRFKKNWQDKFLWVNNDFMALSYPRTKRTSTMLQDSSVLKKSSLMSSRRSTSMVRIDWIASWPLVG